MLMGYWSLFIFCLMPTVIPGGAAGCQDDIAAIDKSGHNCRFWGIISLDVPDSVIADHLVNLPKSIENLSWFNPNGWSIGYYSDSEAGPEIWRGELVAAQDALFDTAVTATMGADPQVVVSHIRMCSSGLCDIPNPHPFERIKNGKHWLMGHNGTIDKQVLLDLIRPEYLAANPPQYGGSISEWIDSDLFFILILQCLEDSRWAVKPALGKAVQLLRDSISGTNEQLNLFLTDGNTLWAYREGNTLYYLFEDGGSAWTAVASQFPSPDMGDWTAMSDGQLITADLDLPPVIEDIEDYFISTGLDEDFYQDILTDPTFFRNYPNPFNASTTIEYILPGRAMVTIAIYDIMGRRIETLIDEVQPRGLHRLQWDGINKKGNKAAGGVYLCRIRTDYFQGIKKILLLN